MGSKLLSGWLGGKLIGLTQKESLLFGVSTLPQLSTSLAAAYAALEFNMLPPEIISAIILLSIITTFLAPILIKLVLRFFKTRELKQI
jgi:Kef-type K+ transport system membrane component KefB